MSRAALASAAAAGGRAVADKPTVTWHANGKFRITNYNAAYTYTLTPSSGTATRVDDIVTLSAASATCTVTATLPKSVAASAAGTFERKAYEAYVSSTYQCGTDAINPCPCGGGCPPCNECNPCYNCCGSVPRMCNNYSGTNFAGQGYTLSPGPLTYPNNGSEWWKAS